MSVKSFPFGIEPADPKAVICRFFPANRLLQFLETGNLWFCRSDLFEQDKEECLPPDWFFMPPGGHPLDIKTIREMNDDRAQTAQFREAFFISCWYLFDDEKAKMWQTYAKEGAAVFSRYDLLHDALATLSDEGFLGLVSYDEARWRTPGPRNLFRLITTKRSQYKDDNEVRALLWIRDDFHATNRHFDINDWPHPLPLTPSPARRGYERPVDLKALVTRVVVSPYADAAAVSSVEALVRRAGLSVPVGPSALVRYKHLLP